MLPQPQTAFQWQYHSGEYHEHVYAFTLTDYDGYTPYYTDNYEVKLALLHIPSGGETKHPLNAERILTTSL